MLLDPLLTAREAKPGILQRVRRQNGVPPSTKALVQHEKNDRRMLEVLPRANAAERHYR